MSDRKRERTEPDRPLPNDFSASAPPDAPTGRILVVDDQENVRRALADILRHVGHEVETCSGAAEALHRLEQNEFDVVITDLKMPGMDGLEFIRHIQQRELEAQVIMVTAHATIGSAVEAMRYGAFDYIEKPFGVDQIERLVARALVRAGRCRLSLSFEMIGDSRPMRLLRERIARIAPTRETVLITGESGTGKELVAQTVHAMSDRASRPMIGLNCPALSEQLMESELFGHERGAFTGADTPRIGRFELADRGTILLDEVTEIAMPLQAKLLRVLQEQAFERVGSSVTRKIDVRVLATTNRDLRAEVAERRFREDLYFRLAVVPLHVAPLRERLDDLTPLAEHFLRRAAQRVGQDPCRLGDDALALMHDYHWPGNVRELENLMTRASVLANHSVITAEDLRPGLIDPSMRPAAAAETDVPVGLSLPEMEQRLIEATLERFDGHRGQTAQALGIGVRTLCNKLRSYGYAPRAKRAAA